MLTSKSNESSHPSSKLLPIQSVALEKWKVRWINRLLNLHNAKLVGFLIFPYKLVDISLKRRFSPIKGIIISALCVHDGFLFPSDTWVNKKPHFNFPIPWNVQSALTLSQASRILWLHNEYSEMLTLIVPWGSGQNSMLDVLAFKISVSSGQMLNQFLFLPWLMVPFPLPQSH